MKPVALLLAGLAIGLGASDACGEWRLQVHHDGQTKTFLLSHVDSMTFYADSAEAGMVTVPAGTFAVGDTAGCQDTLVVTLTRDFYLGQHEVTNQEYLQAVQWAYDQGYVTATTTQVRDNLDGSTVVLLDMGSDNSEIRFDGAGTFFLREAPAFDAQLAYPDGYDPTDHPVKSVTWFGAARYCDWRSMQAVLPRAYDHSGGWECNGNDPYGAQGYRLPTEAEWEYAAQYDDGRFFPWGDEDLQPDCDRVNYRDPGGYCVRWTTPVGSYPSAPEGLGLSDMAGNIQEWCNDWYQCGSYSAPTDPVGPLSGTIRVLRGGHAGSAGDLIRSAARQGDLPAGRNHRIGFRIARTAGP